MAQAATNTKGKAKIQKTGGYLMDYRKLPRGAERLSTIGLGMGNIYLSPDDEIERALFYAVDHGVNLYDMCCGRMEVYRLFGKAVAGRRDKVYTQMHFGATYKEENYGLSRDLTLIQKSFEKMLRAVDTDYTDFGYIHCLDEDKDFETIMKNGVWDYVCSLKEQGVVRHIGFSTHSPAMARRFLETGMTDICMFSLNPAYDYSKGGAGQRQYGGTAGSLPGNPAPGRRDHGHEAIRRRAAPGRRKIAAEPGFDQSAMHPIRPGPPRRPLLSARRVHRPGGQGRSRFL